MKNHMIEIKTVTRTIYVIINVWINMYFHYIWQAQNLCTPGYTMAQTIL